MHVDKSMIAPALRARGALVQAVLPQFTEKFFLRAKKMMGLMTGKCRSKLRYEQIYVPRADGGVLRLCVYGPREPRTAVPGLLWIHGGGYGLGAPEQDECFIKRFIEASGCVVVSPDYRLSIEAPYPAALDDCYTALLWLKENGGRYGMRSDQIMVGGDSAGGGLAAAVTLRARDSGDVNLAFQMPLYPMIDDRMTSESARDNDAPVWNAKSSELGWKLYLGPLFGGDNVPYCAAPARAEDLRGLPPACSFVGGIEPFRDETIAYMDKLRAAGVPVRLKVYDGCYHAFDIICPGSSAAKDATQFLMDGFRYAVEHYFAAQK